jgi:ribosomal protein S12 methylthiotransferase accessory factor
MEAIEYAYGEYAYSNKQLNIIAIAEFIGQLPSNVKIEDFAILFGKRAKTDELIACIECQNLFDNKPYLLPAQLVFIPFSENPGVNLFGTTTNGLASGNTIKEATLHAICELLERDVTSFNLVKNATLFVNVEQSTKRISQMKTQIEAAGLLFALRYANNPFGLPYFEAYVIDEYNSDCTSISSGYGLHPVKEIAAIRAIAEAVQSRLTVIHGGRDDIIDDFEFYEQFNNDKKHDLYLTKKNEIIAADAIIPFDDITEPQAPETIDQALKLIISILKVNGMEDIFRYVFTEPDDKLQVVKIIIPKLENFSDKLKRMGPRLLSYILNEGN